MVIRYDEEANIRKLSDVGVRSRVLFALLCALRVLPMYRQFHDSTGRGNPDQLEALLERLWNDVTGQEMGAAELQVALDTCMHLIPREDEGWDGETQAYAEDAAAALAYALRARLSGDPREAALAGRRVYEAVDYFLNSTGGLPLDASEEVILSHPLIQAELQRQQRDLDEIAQMARTEFSPSRLREMRERSKGEAEILTEK
jgi:uncharacterized protein YjaG (DUF416 family)